MQHPSSPRRTGIAAADTRITYFRTFLILPAPAILASITSSGNLLTHEIDAAFMSPDLLRAEARHQPDHKAAGGWRKHHPNGAAAGLASGMLLTPKWPNQTRFVTSAISFRRIQAVAALALPTTSVGGEVAKLVTMPRGDAGLVDVLAHGEGFYGKD
jgi:hypothetical protein